MMCFKVCTGSSKFTDWNEFCKTFMAEFCLKNKTQMALTRLKMPSFYQGHWMVNEYVDKFYNLINTAEYKEGLVIIIKF
jgi:hypothetical protein